MSATTETDGRMLLTWLRLLGWQTQTSRDGELVFGVAAHIDSDGTSVRVAGRARSEGELALQLFQSAMGALDRPQTLAQRLAMAA